MRKARRVSARLRYAGIGLSVVVLVTALLWAVAPAWFTGYDPIHGEIAHRLRAPSAGHWFGTDHLGRDLYARIVYGTRLSLAAALAAMAIALAAGVLLGAAAGFFGGWVDQVVLRVTDVLLAVPGLLLALAVVTVLGFGLVNVAVAVGIAGVAGFTRVMRTEVRRVRRVAFVEAARAGGVRAGANLLLHVLPNSIGPVLAMAALDIGGALLTVSALSFLGFGAAPPTPEWGALVAGGRDYLGAAWWLSAFPGLAIGLLILAATRVVRWLDRTGDES